MRGVFAKQFAWLSFMLFMSILIVGVSFVAASSGYISAMQQASLTKNAEAVSRLVSYELTERRGQLDPRLRISLATIAYTSDTHILICDVRGQILMCSDGPFCIDHAGLYVPEALAQSVAEYGAFSEQSTLGGIYDARYELAACGMDFDGQHAGFIIAATRASETKALAAAISRIFLIVSFIVLFLSSVSAYIVTKRMTKPLKAMAESAQNYARGDFSTRVSLSPNINDEISVLCHNFNSMADALQRLEELRQGFIADISHELRTPMTVILGYVDGILDGAIPSENQNEYLETIRGEVSRLSRLVSRMLDASNMQSGKLTLTRRPVNVSEQIRRVILGFERRIEDKELNVEFTLPDDDITVSFDPDSLTQVLTNLTDNAIKFASPKGRLGISLTHKGSKAYVSVLNSGAGIPPEDLPFLFDRFYKTDKSRSGDKNGLGLGLFIVKGIIQSHGESIQVTSENGVTTFTFSLSMR
ncbi:MAG: HAMP domain-containing histidine kinase [Oscillospiraceae bacterium]|nr:HAMP domain-containing histidine kinase [Oscillospiraceae bacterium]